MESPQSLPDVVKAADLARLDQASWQTQRGKMVKTCKQCHSVNFGKEQLQHGDEMIRNADHLMAQAIRPSAQMRREHTSQVGRLPVSPVPLSAGSDEQECRLFGRFLFALQASKIFDDNAASIDVDIALGLKAAQVSGDQLANGT